MATGGNLAFYAGTCKLLKKNICVIGARTQWAECCGTKIRWPSALSLSSSFVSVWRRVAEQNLQWSVTKHSALDRIISCQLHSQQVQLCYRSDQRPWDFVCARPTFTSLGCRWGLSLSKPKWVSSLKSKEGLDPIIASLEYQAAEGSLLMPSEEQKKIPEFSVGPAGGGAVPE